MWEPVARYCPPPRVVMMDLSDVAVFMAALTAVYLLPGPDMVLVMSTSALRGPNSGLMVALGLAFSRALHVALSALGLAALFHTHPLLFDSVRWIGAAYLLWLAWKMFSSDAIRASETATEAHSGLTGLRRGFLTNLLNPKALMFCALLLPQFVSTQHDLTGQYLILGSALVGLGLLFDAIYAFSASTLARRLSGARCIQNAAKLVFSSVFGVAAVRLAFSGS